MAPRSRLVGWKGPGRSGQPELESVRDFADTPAGQFWVSLADFDQRDGEFLGPESEQYEQWLASQRWAATESQLGGRSPV